MDEGMIQFFEKHMYKEHYANVKPRPSEFDNWENDFGVAMQYRNWIELESDVPSMKLDLPCDNIKSMEFEVNQLLNRFVKHRGEQHPGWKSLTLHGYDEYTTDDWNSEEYKDRGWTEMPEYKWTLIAEKCPTIVNWIKTYMPFNEYHRIRFMLLEPGGYIKPHVDFDRRKLAAFNFAITNPPGIEFCMEDAGLIPWKAGECRAIDIGRYHTVRNLGKSPRVHMIIHGRPSNEHVLTMCRSYDKLAEEYGK